MNIERLRSHIANVTPARRARPRNSFGPLAAAVVLVMGLLLVAQIASTL